MELKAEGISKQFLRKGKANNVIDAVKETDFELEEGKLTVLTGRSGSGKSTLLNMLSGVLEPTGGRVLLGEQDLYQLEDKDRSEIRNRCFGYIPQGQSAIMSLNVLENILLPYTLYGEPTGSAEEYAKELLKRMGISDLAEAMPDELSGGEMRRMAIARALIKRPSVVFADEPTGDLDDENTGVVLELLKSIAKDGTAVLLVTHENEAKKYADRLYRMSGGVLES